MHINNLHYMGGICKEEWHWYLLIKLSFWWIHNLTSGTYLWMLDISSHCAVIVAYKEINYRTSIMELIFYHLQNCSSLHTFRYHLKVILALAFLCFLSPLISSITLLSVLWIEDHTNNELGYPTNIKSCLIEESYILPDDLFF